MEANRPAMTATEGHHRPVQAVGADGCPGGWVAAVECGDGSTRAIRFAGEDAGAVIEAFPDAVVLLDVPIGLADRGPRGADVEARAAIGARRSSVFPAPIRPMLRAESWEEACRIRRDVEGGACSRQLAAILPRIRAVDARMTPGLQARVMEGHPEVSFAAMAQRRGLEHHKRGPLGRTERLTLIASHFPDAPRRIAAMPTSIRGDAVDAYALLWSARRVRAGSARRLPDGWVETDSRGLRCEMVW